MLHLLHPAFVHFSVAFLLAGALAESLGILLGREKAERLGGVLVLLGTASVVVTVTTGFLAQNALDIPAGARELVERHERAGLGILGLFLTSQVWKGWHRGLLPAGQRTAYAALLLLGAALVAYGAFVGGELVYGFGVGVGIH